MTGVRHNLSSSPEYRAWIGMIGRCENVERELFARYGGRGITVCGRWRNSFQAFYVDMGPKPFTQAQVDRINNDGDYEPGNCRWATPRQNANNRSTNRVIEFQGRKQTVADWSRELGVHPNTLCKRLAKWPLEKAMTEPLNIPMRRTPQ